MLPVLLKTALFKLFEVLSYIHNRKNTSLYDSNFKRYLPV